MTKLLTDDGFEDGFSTGSGTPEAVLVLLQNYVLIIRQQFHGCLRLQIDSSSDRFNVDCVLILNH